MNANATTTALVRSEAEVGQRGVQLKTMGEMAAFAIQVSKSNLAPKGMNTPEQCMVAIQAGMEAGLSPMRSLQSLVVINGNLSWKGDAALSLVRASGRLEWIRWSYTGEATDRACVVESKRLGNDNVFSTTFSVADARRAGLWGKSGPWTQYPQRMIYYRALGFHLRDYYGDILNGMAIAEEVQDFPTRHITVTERPAPAAADPLLADVAAQDADFIDPPHEDIVDEPHMDVVDAEPAEHEDDLI